MRAIQRIVLHTVSGIPEFISRRITREFSRFTSRDESDIGGIAIVSSRRFFLSRSAFNHSPRGGMMQFPRLIALPCRRGFPDDGRVLFTRVFSLRRLDTYVSPATYNVE